MLIGADAMRPKSTDMFTVPGIDIQNQMEGTNNAITQTLSFRPPSISLLLPAPEGGIDFSLQCIMIYLMGIIDSDRIVLFVRH